MRMASGPTREEINFCYIFFRVVNCGPYFQNSECPNDLLFGGLGFLSALEEEGVKEGQI